MTDTKSQTVDSDIPDNYTIINRPDGKKYIVPQFLVPSLDHSMAAYHKKVEMEVDISNAEGLNPFAESAPTYSTLAGTLHIPPDPMLTDEELLRQHAKARALQERLGISYCDAAHCLYMIEIEKLKIADMQRKAFENFDKRTSNSLEGLAKRHNHNSNYLTMYESKNKKSGGSLNKLWIMNE